MKLTPLDIRHKEFKRALRGYGDAEVDEFLDSIADEFERLCKENAELNESVASMEEALSGYKRMEDALHKALVSAQASAEEIRQNATRSAQLVMNEAERKAQQLMHEAYSEKQAVEESTARLRSAEQDFRFKFRQVLEGYLKTAREAPSAEADAVSAVPGQSGEPLQRATDSTQVVSGGDTASPAPAPETATSAFKKPPATPETATSADENPPAATADDFAEVFPVSADESAASTQADSAAAGRPLVGRDRISFGRSDDLLADVDIGVSENEFKW
jgi:cell division initiation protein